VQVRLMARWITAGSRRGARVRAVLRRL